MDAEDIRLPGMAAEELRRRVDDLSTIPWVPGRCRFPETGEDCQCGIHVWGMP